MNNCNVAKDLIPLYVEGLTNEDSSKFVEEHIATCKECRAYYEMVKEDYEKNVQSQIAPSKKQLDELVLKLNKYQDTIKLTSVLIAIFFACTITGADVEFLSTIPFLILTPFICRLFYNKSLPIILSVIPFGIIGGLLSENDSSYVPFFMVIAFILGTIGVVAAILIKAGIKKLKPSLKIVFILTGIALLIVSSLGYFSFFGNPIGYVNALIKTKQYVDETYEDDTLTFTGVSYNFKDGLHFGKYDYLINGMNQTADITVTRNGDVYDHYKFMLELQFSEERSADLKADIAAAVDFSPITIIAEPVESLAITKDELNWSYHLLSYDPERLEKATKLRIQESEKLQYTIKFGPFDFDYLELTKEEFMQKVKAIHQTLIEREVPFHSIKVEASDHDHYIQRITFNKTTDERDLSKLYERGEKIN